MRRIVSRNTKMPKFDARRAFFAIRFLNGLKTEKDIINVAREIKMDMSGYKDFTRSEEENEKFYQKLLCCVGDHGLIVTKNKSNLQAYKTLRKKDLPLYNLQILVDILYDRNPEMIREILGEEFFVLTPEEEEEIEDLKKTSQELEQKKGEEQVVSGDDEKTAFGPGQPGWEELENLKRENEHLLKKLKKYDEEFLKKDKQLADLREKWKALKNLRDDYEDLVQENKKLREENGEHVKFREEYALVQEKIAYYERMAEFKKILFLDMVPKNQEFFPYAYETVSLRDLSGASGELQFTEVWYCARKYNPMVLAGIYQTISQKYGKIDLLDFDEEWLRKLEIEVMK